MSLLHRIVFLFSFFCLITVTFSDVVVQSEALQRFANCSDPQKIQIRTAWNEAVQIATWVNARMDFPSPHAELASSGNRNTIKINKMILGVNKYFRVGVFANLLALITQASIYGLAWGWNPSHWSVNISCVDWKGRCAPPGKKGAVAYTTNPETRDGKEGIWMDTMTFCAEFFDEKTQYMGSCDALLVEVQNIYNRYETFGNLDLYRCWGYVVLHELFHLNSLSRVADTGHVWDRKVWYYAPGADIPERKVVYGVILSKVLALLQDRRTGIQETCDDNPEFCSKPINFLGSEPFDVSPANWTLPLPDPVVTVSSAGPFTMPLDPNLLCYEGLYMDASIQPSVSVTFAVLSMETFCQDIDTVILDPNVTTDVPVPYDPGYDDDTLLWIRAGYQVGDPTCTGEVSLLSDECNLQLSTVLTECGSSGLSPQSYGGSRVWGCINWHLRLLLPSLTKAHTAVCLMTICFQAPAFVDTQLRQDLQKYIR
ncbi:uncharacterized protein LY89DRAFT_732372 [Mollisia scopiformis]|uniref:Uncharacterized protein n=1 Tax=Mollisia scopiformis TaxID=149040 RepID=A0A194XFA1_MOLSC|nr:uncharacterized protein LY89DRAFT_732372 [Mollisia scopiformis]KUJ18826.1 hypothetical protein LY89DRAFT_732372 [Mollisia scopiformis]